MSPVPAALGAVLVVAATVVTLALRGQAWYARDLVSFRCRVGRPTSGRRRHRTRWCIRCTRAAWVNDVLLLRAGVLRLWLVPLEVGVARDVMVRVLEPGEVRGLGPRPSALRFTLRFAGEMEIAVAAEDAGRLVGPFLAAALSDLPEAPRERGG
jgi:hypothetical protein